jgi:hypothetical protein
MVPKTQAKELLAKPGIAGSDRSFLGSLHPCGRVGGGGLFASNLLP